MDLTILTSISEGQPLTILEGYAAKKPVIATDVGNCAGLIYCEGDDKLGDAGILCHIMNTEELAEAMIDMAKYPEKRIKMGEVGYERCKAKYQLKQMQQTYKDLYNRIFKFNFPDRESELVAEVNEEN
jgi:glycosyltransferase involved in cell wall biosynthesis